MIVLDANITLEILEQRRLYDAVLETLELYQQQEEVAALSALTISNTFYLAERHKLPVERVETLVNQFKVFDVLASDVDWALQHYAKKDFEDSLQVAAALREGCATFLTIDAQLAKKYGHLLNIVLIQR